MVLAHSLRDAGTTRKLAVLVTLDSVSAEAVTLLRVGAHRASPDKAGKTCSDSPPS